GDVAFPVHQPDRPARFCVRIAAFATAAVATGPAWVHIANHHGDRHLAENAIGELPARPRGACYSCRPVGPGDPRRRAVVAPDHPYYCALAAAAAPDDCASAHWGHSRHL